MGLSAELNHPDYDTRIAIIKNKLYRDGVEMPEDIIEFWPTISKPTSGNWKVL